MNFPAIYQLRKNGDEGGYPDQQHKLIYVETFNRDMVLDKACFPITARFSETGKRSYYDDYEVVPLENAELPYIGNEFWWRLMRNQPRRVIVKETPTENFPHFTVVDVENPHLVFAALEHELRPV